MNTTRTVILSLLITASLNIKAEQINFCNDPEVNQEWERLIKKNGHHPEWQSMYSLRKKLCSSVDNGQLSLESAGERFEEQRSNMIEQLRKRLEQKHGKQTSKV